METVLNVKRNLTGAFRKTDQSIFVLHIIATISKNRYKDVVCKQFGSQTRPHMMWA